VSLSLPIARFYPKFLVDMTISRVATKRCTASIGDVEQRLDQRPSVHFGPPLTFLPLTVGGGGRSGKVVSPMRALHNMSPSQHFKTPPIKSTYYLPPASESYQTAYPILPTSLFHHTPLSPVTCHTPHTRS
jgi:hypothetical protein